MSTSLNNGLRFTFQKKEMPELQSLDKAKLMQVLGGHEKGLVRI